MGIRSAAISLAPHEGQWDRVVKRDLPEGMRQIQIFMKLPEASPSMAIKSTGKNHSLMAVSPLCIGPKII